MPKTSRTTGDAGYVDRNVSTASTTATLAQIRRTIVGAQGFAGRYLRADADDVEAAVRRLSAVQLDSIACMRRRQKRIGVAVVVIVLTILSTCKSRKQGSRCRPCFSLGWGQLFCWKLR